MYKEFVATLEADKKIGHLNIIDLQSWHRRVEGEMTWIWSKTGTPVLN